MCDEDLKSLVRRLRGRYDELDVVRLDLSIDDQAEFNILGELISFLEDKTGDQGPHKH